MIELWLVSAEWSLKHVQGVKEDCMFVLLKCLVEHDETGEAAETFNLSFFSEVLQDLRRDLVVLDDI